MKIAVVGTGYVGLVTGTCLAEIGNTVVCVDTDKAKVAKMQNSQVPIYEPDLETIFKRNIAENRLTFTTDLKAGVKGAKAIFLALPTPPGEDGSADLSCVLGVADELSNILESYTVIVNKSTVPIGTAEKVAERLSVKSEASLDVVSNPEFLREGFAVEDFMKPDRIVIGTNSDKARQVLAELYAPFVDQGSPLLFMDVRSSEMTKYAANSFLATKISFMNEIANLSEKLGVDVDAVRLGIGADDRIGRRFLFAGIGYGGSCFPKDVTALQKIAQVSGYDFKILDSVNQVNRDQRKLLVEKIKNHFGGQLSGRKFALWGLAFKPDTDDIREAPSVDIIKGLIKAGATVTAFDPEANGNISQLFAGEKGLKLVEHQYDALDGANALVIATEWAVFKSPEFATIKNKLKTATIFDGRNIYHPTDMEKQGFHYESIGRKVAQGE